MSERETYEPSRDAVDALADRLFAKATGVAFSEVWESARLELLIERRTPMTLTDETINGWDANDLPAGSVIVHMSGGDAHLRRDDGRWTNAAGNFIEHGNSEYRVLYRATDPVQVQAQRPGARRD